MRRNVFILLLIIVTAFVAGCKKESESPVMFAAKDYYPLAAGKRFIYRLDSSVSINFGAALVTHSYAAKDSIINTVPDNLGNTSYLIYRYLTDTLMTQAWTYQSAYYVTSLPNKIEVTDEDNNRLIALTSPVQENNSWKGNAYLDTKSAGSKIQYMNNWDYTYNNVNRPYTAGSVVYDSAAIVLQKDALYPDAPFDPDAFQQRDLSIEVYGKNIGLVYKEFLHWVWQPPNSESATAHYQDGSYGIKLTLLDHN